MTNDNKRSYTSVWVSARNNTLCIHVGQSPPLRQSKVSGNILSSKVTPGKGGILYYPLVIISLSKRGVVCGKPYKNNEAITEGSSCTNDGQALTIASSNHALCGFTDVAPRAIYIERQKFGRRTCDRLINRPSGVLCYITGFIF